MNATRVKIGAPLGDITGERLRGWAKLQMLETQPEYSGKLRTYINNMQNAGEEDQAARNAFDMNAAKLAAQVDAYLKAGKFEAAPVNGKALSPSRDFIEKNLDRATVDALLAELAAGGKSFPPDSPRGLLAKNTMPALELAIRANPKWAEPQFKIAALETDAGAQDRAAEDGGIAGSAQRDLLADAGDGAGGRQFVRGRREILDCGGARRPATPQEKAADSSGEAGSGREPGRVRCCRETAAAGRRGARSAAREGQCGGGDPCGGTGRESAHGREQRERQGRGAVVWRSHGAKSFRHADARRVPRPAGRCA